MQVTLTVANQVYQGEVTETQIKNLVEQGIRYRLLNTDKHKRAGAFQSCLTGREVSDAAIVAKLKAMSAEELQELLESNNLL